MSSVRNYLNNARNQANQNYAGFTGNPANNTGGFGNYVNYAGVNPGASPGYGQVGQRTTVQADGAGGNFQPQSQPYIITISNASATAVSNFDILGAYTYINGTSMPSTPTGTVSFTSTPGSMQVTATGSTGFNITVSSSIANVNYQQFLYQSMTQPFQVGLTYVESVGGSASQITTPMTLNTQDANGNQMLRTIVPVIDPYQQQTNIVAVKQLYAIDGFTKITFTTIFASAVFRVQFYPASNVNLASGLSGAPVAQSYTNPNIAGVPTIVR